MAQSVGTGYNTSAQQKSVTKPTVRPKTVTQSPAIGGYPAKGATITRTPAATGTAGYPAKPTTAAAVGRAVSVNKTGQYAKPVAPAPVIPGPVQETAAPAAVTPQDPNQDSQYVQEMAAYAAALKQFQDKQLFDAGTQQQNTTSTLAELGQKQTEDQGSLLEDFASRGLGDSGIYLTERQKLDSQYGDQKSQLEQLLQQFLGGQRTDAQAFESQQKINKDSAAQQAIQRLLAARGVG